MDSRSAVFFGHGLQRSLRGDDRGQHLEVMMSPVSPKSSQRVQWRRPGPGAGAPSPVPALALGAA